MNYYHTLNLPIILRGPLGNPKILVPYERYFLSPVQAMAVVPIISFLVSIVLAVSFSFMLMIVSIVSQKTVIFATVVFGISLYMIMGFYSGYWIGHRTKKLTFLVVFISSQLCGALCVFVVFSIQHFLSSLKSTNVLVPILLDIYKSLTTLDIFWKCSVTYLLFALIGCPYGIRMKKEKYLGFLLRNLRPGDRDALLELAYESAVSLQEVKAIVLSK